MSDNAARGVNSVDVHVGQKVRLRRSLMNLSQERLGEALGITFQQVQKYEKGVNRIGASRLFEIAQVLEVPISFFFEGLNAEANAGFSDNDQTPYVNDLISSPDGIQLAKAYSRLPNAEIRRKFIELMKVVADQHEDSSD